MQRSFAYSRLVRWDLEHFFGITLEADMSLIAAITGALVGGAAAAASDIATSELKNAFQTAKSFLLEKIGFELGSDKVSDEVENAVQQVSFGEIGRLEAIANEIAEQLDKLPQKEQQTIGVNARDIKADLAKFGNVSAKDGGIGVQIERGSFGSLEFGDIDAEGKKK